jgi:hypothetical protein
MGSDTRMDMIIMKRRKDCYDELRTVVLAIQSLHLPRSEDVEGMTLPRDHSV